jgi:GntR family transcriptional repressor for pyruvate dehydrogenase complex
VKPRDRRAAELVVDHIRALIVHGKLTKGARLRTERELVQDLKVSRTSVRAGLQALIAKGVLVAKRGAGTFVAAGPPALDSEALGFFMALHGVPRHEIFEARRTLEVGVAGLAADRAKGDALAAISDGVIGLFASVDDPQAFLVWDIRFHGAVASASGNRILASVVEMVSALFYEQRRLTAHRQRDLRSSAGVHNEIYQAIRKHDRRLAEQLMNTHLLEAERLQEAEGPEQPDDRPEHHAARGRRSGKRPGVSPTR